MDLKKYYRRIREIEAGITADSAVVVSRATPEGGRAGVLVEAPREVAARLVADGAAELADSTQSADYRESLAAAHQDEERRRAAARIQVSIVRESDLRALAPEQPAAASRPPRSRSGPQTPTT